MNVVIVRGAMEVRTYDKKKKRTVLGGRVDGKTYHRNVKNKHYMVKHHGYGVQSTIITKLVQDGIRFIVLHAKSVDLKASLAVWIKRGISVDYGHGLQTFLSTEFMEKTK